VAQVVEHLLEAMSSNPSTTKKAKQNKSYKHHLVAVNKKFIFKKSKCLHCPEKFNRLI
jgi:hypothetical protein